jgi:hypothetical protein
MKTILSPSAARLLRDLVNAERDAIRSGRTIYGTTQDNDDALADLDEIDELAEAIQSGAYA